MKKLLFAAVPFLLPVVTYAQVTPIGQGEPTDANFDQVKKLISELFNVVNLFIPLLIGIATVVFFYGLIRFVLASGGENKEQARNVMIFGLLTLFVMVTVWGIVNFAANALGLDFGRGAAVSPIVVPGDIPQVRFDPVL